MSLFKNSGLNERQNNRITIEIKETIKPFLAALSLFCIKRSSYFIFIKAKKERKAKKAMLPVIGAKIAKIEA